MDLVCSLWRILNTNFIAQVIGGLSANLIFWILFEKRIRATLEITEKKKLSQQFLEEILCNRRVAEMIIETRNSDLTNFLKYKTGLITNFLSAEPLDLSKEFYAKARVLSATALDKDNMLIDITWFSPSSTQSQRNQYKDTLIENAYLNIKSIDKILSDQRFQAEMKKLGLDK